ncbi:hypothetical protein Cgig2_030220 [Carnegiea gigantea]|uniref:Uncharacterized protein n=1 Tax=Carnegiea gigantea TaxID=171969 RepID=A0A9Q1GHT1_9CARY|nr:hypothetical protein Cgig2_030220 [Carnegiea gigantea]
MGKDIRDLVVHYKDRVIKIMDVEMEKYNCMELFRDARASAKESGIEFPKLTKFWEDVRSKCIPIHMYDMKKPSDNQKHVKSLDQTSASTAQSLPQIVAVESKKNVRMVSGVEDLTDSQANIWANSLIVSPAVALVKPVAHRPVTRSIANSPVKPTPSSQSRSRESLPQPKSTSLKKSCKYPAKPTSTSLPKPTAKASPPAEGSRVIVTSVDDNPPSDDDSEDEDFVVDGEDVDDSEDVSLDEENNSSESGDDEQLEVQVEQRMQLGAEIIDSDADGDLIVNKMTRTIRQGTLWTRNRDGKFDTNLICDDNTNNFVKSFNHAIVKFRGLPILTMLEEIRKLIRSRFVKRFEKSQKWNGRLVSFVHKKLLITEMESRNCTHLVHANQGEFDVTEGHTNFTVRLQDKFYDYRKWQLTGLHYKHAARCIFRMKQQLEDYMEDYFTLEKYRNLYNHIEKRNLPNLNQPYAQRKIGRPPEHKRRESLNVPLPESQSQQLPHKAINQKEEETTEGRVPKPRGRPKKQKVATLTPTPSTTAAAQAGPSTQCSQVGASQAT